MVARSEFGPKLINNKKERVSGFDPFRVLSSPAVGLLNRNQPYFGAVRDLMTCSQDPWNTVK